MTKATQYFLLVLMLALPSLASCGDSTHDKGISIEGYIAGQRIIDYKTARKVFWKGLYNNGGETLYCGRKLTTAYNKGVNIEHVFPASWMAYDLRCGKRKQCRVNSPQFNLIEADLHNLYPSRSDINKARSNYKFAIIRAEPRNYGACDFEINERERMVEPAPNARGRIARSMLYMADEYDLYLKHKLKKLMQAWDEKYPPQQTEYTRNDRVEILQGNRNRYIDKHR